jgi:transcriptional regulator with GAF, ATPase, and Fis domain
MQKMIGEFAECIRPVIDFDRMGIATRINQAEMEVLALCANGAMKPAHTGRRFRYHGTVGEWVWKRKRPFVGKVKAEVRAFPETYQQFQAEGMESNCVVALALPDRGPTFVYWLSRNRACYSQDNLPLILRACEYLKPVIHFCTEVERVRSMSENAFERALGQLFAVGASARASHALPTLEEVQALYVRRVLEKTNWVIEGADGAAAILGMPASTLRSRMKKMTIYRN